jgi:hypothetical protein
MRRLAALVCLTFALLLVALDFVPETLAQSSRREIIVAQNSGPGGFFRKLFGRRKQQAQPRKPFQLFPDFDANERAAKPPPKRRERKARPAAPQPREVAAVEKAPDAKRALVIGDFMAGALAKGLADAYRENAKIVVIDATSGSSGLVRDDYFNWPAQLPGMVAEQKPDTILVMIGANDRQQIKSPAGTQDMGSDAWRAVYTSRIVALADALKATGRPVLWGGLVPVASSAMSRDYSALNGIVREQLEAKGLKFVDMWNGFADEDGTYVALGPDVRGQAVQLRADDGLNFTRAGQRKLAYFVEQDLNDMFGAPSVVAPDDERVMSAAPEAGPSIGPMVPLDTLSVLGGGELSGSVSDKERGLVATAIAANLAKPDAVPPPPTRADSFLWPPPREAASVAARIRGPR